MQVIVITSEKYYHCLDPFLYLWQKYAGDEDMLGYLDLIVVGHSTPSLAHTIKFHSLGDQSAWPVTRWSDKLIKILNEVAAEQFILMLEDYWLVRAVDIVAIKMLFDYARQFQNVLKIDLTYDRLYINGGSTFLFGANTYDNVDYLDLIKSPHGTPYQMSLWGGIWNREQMKRVLIPGETPQDIEIHGTSRVTDDMLVLGTRQAPMLHGNIYQSRNNGEPAYEDGGWKVKAHDLEFMRQRGWIK
jgi:hypothetical protein